MSEIKRVLVTGGAGYVGSALVPRLLEKGYDVRLLDLFIYGDHVLDAVKDDPRLSRIRGDIRNPALVREAMRGCDAVIHLACISNDPSFELDPVLGKSINLDAFPDLVSAAQEAGVKRFIYASSSSVYGVKNEPDVREDAKPEPLTDYSRFKLDCERILMDMAGSGGLTCAILRPATICGYAPRMRLDLTVNILTIHALVNRRIRVFGGGQLRPNLNIRDMVRAYELFLSAPADKIHGVPFNVGFQNYAVEEIARIVKRTLGDEGIELVYEPTDDIRSYHVNSDRVRQVLGFVPKHTVEE
ncbi:MAG: NAD-dependent epimerase/dehydratase, partial [Lentisphaerae bacterium]|nr:NAD-dependent epimerase/dehydratase [Lentisphaerota bacterium]